MAGRRLFHFANCQGDLSANSYFTQAVTNRIWLDRLMGGNNALNDLKISNEAEYSLSANLGITYREDIALRLRKIDLFFSQEDANARTFEIEDLHGWARDNRSLLLSAAYSIFHHWQLQDRAEGFPFASFKRWGRIVGGWMKIAELGDPTQPHAEEALYSGDVRTEAMKAIYELAFGLHPETWIAKKDLYKLVEANQEEDERLVFFGDLRGEYRKSAQTKLGKSITAFSGRELSGIFMLLDDSLTESQKWLVRFTKESPPKQRATPTTSRT
jgi:hypothetical protein